jgi:Zn-dependent protease
MFYALLLFSLSVHESAHAWAALRMGDDTAARLGRISLNPLVHIDPIGTFVIPMLQIFGGALLGGIPLIGWAKPTPYNPANFRRDRSLAYGHVSVAAAGPLSNALLALGFTALLFVAVRVFGQLPQATGRLLWTGVTMNVLLAVFNLVPLPPLDGSKVVSFGLPRALGGAYDRLIGPYGGWILLLLFATGILGRLLRPIYRAVLSVLQSFL